MRIPLQFKYLLLSGLTFFLASQPILSQAAGAGFCKHYANEAIAQFKQGQASGCKNLNFPVWSMDHAHHYNWCLKTPETEVAAGRKLRQDALDQCQAAGVIKKLAQQAPTYYQTKESTCASYAEMAVAQNKMKEEHNCYLLKGPRWNSEYKDHYNWCLQGENVKYAAPENKGREVALDRCINPRYLINVTLEKVEVHDDCDNVSMGEWALSLIVDGKDMNSNSVHKTRQWPGRGTAATVGTGSTFYPKIQISLPDMHASENITVAMVGVDCDGDIFSSNYESWSFSDWGQPINCKNYESFPELSGANDSMGKPTLILSPVQWELGGDFQLKAPANTSCSEISAYTAYINVTSTQKAYAPPGRVK